MKEVKKPIILSYGEQKEEKGDNKNVYVYAEVKNMPWVSKGQFGLIFLTCCETHDKFPDF